MNPAAGYYDVVIDLACKAFRDESPYYHKVSCALTRYPCWAMAPNTVELDISALQQVLKAVHERTSAQTFGCCGVSGGKHIDIAFNTTAACFRPWPLARSSHYLQSVLSPDFKLLLTAEGTHWDALDGLGVSAEENAFEALGRLAAGMAGLHCFNNLFARVGTCLCVHMQAGLLAPYAYLQLAETALSELQVMHFAPGALTFRPDETGQGDCSEDSLQLNLALSKFSGLIHPKQVCPPPLLACPAFTGQGWLGSVHLATSHCEQTHAHSYVDACLAMHFILCRFDPPCLSNCCHPRHDVSDSWTCATTETDECLLHGHGMSSHATKAEGSDCKAYMCRWMTH